MKKQRILILGNSASGLYDFRNELLLSFLEKYEVYVSLPDVRRILGDECYLGTKTNRKTVGKSFKNKKRIPTDPGDRVVLLGDHEGLIPEECFFRVAQRLRESTRGGGQASPYRGLVVCGGCGSRMMLRTRSGREPALVCSKWHRQGCRACTSHHLIRPSTGDSPLSRDISTMNDADTDERIRLNHRQSNFEISFSSDSYQDADKTIYAYRMKGLSDTWNILPQGQRSVAFFDIPPGKYVLELKAANGDGVWGDKVISVGFKVDPSPFLSVWAYIIYAMIAAASALLVSLYVKHKRRFKEELDQKDAEISDLYKKKYVAGPSEIVVTSMEDELLKKALYFVEQNMDNSEYSVEDFVSDMALGRTVLYQKINAITGLSIKEFILDIRIKRSAKLLAESDKTISEISYMTGFVNPKYFSTIFRKRLGQTPSEYRKKFK